MYNLFCCCYCCSTWMWPDSTALAQWSNKYLFGTHPLGSCTSASDRRKGLERSMSEMPIMSQASAQVLSLIQSSQQSSHGLFSLLFYSLENRLREAESKFLEVPQLQRCRNKIHMPFWETPKAKLFSEYPIALPQKRYIPEKGEKVSLKHLLCFKKVKPIANTQLLNF